MELYKGDTIKEVKTNTGFGMENTVANSTLLWEVVRVNKKTYGLKCIDGYMKGCCANLCKDFKEQSTDVYGTVTTRTLAN